MERKRPEFDHSKVVHSNAYLIEQLLENTIICGHPSLDQEYISAQITKRRELGALNEQEEAKIKEIGLLAIDPDNIF